MTLQDVMLWTFRYGWVLFAFGILAPLAMLGLITFAVLHEDDCPCSECRTRP